MSRMLILLLLLWYSNAYCGSVGDTIADVALVTDVPVQVLLAVCRAESSLKAGKPYQDGGTLTYRPCGVKLNAARDAGYEGPAEALEDVATNAFFAANYLKYLRARYGQWTRAIVAYNYGPSVVDKMSEAQCERTKYFKRVMKGYRHAYE